MKSIKISLHWGVSFMLSSVLQGESQNSKETLFLEFRGKLSNMFKGIYTDIVQVSPKIYFNVPMNCLSFYKVTTILFFFSILSITGIYFS